MNWGSLALRGLLANMFAVCFFMYPFVTFQARMIMFFIFVVLYGVISLMAGFGHKMTAMTVLEILQSAACLGIAVALLYLPLRTDTALIFLIALWAISVGILKFILSYFWSKDIPHRWLPKAGGIMAMLIGLVTLIYINSEKNIWAVSLFLGSFTFIFGILLLAFSMDLRSLQQEE